MFRLSQTNLQFAEEEMEATIIDPLTFFPHEVSIYIFEFLDIRSLVRCEQVNHFWQKMAQDSNLWKQMLLKYPRLTIIPRKDQTIQCLLSKRRRYDWQGIFMTQAKKHIQENWKNQAGRTCNTTFSIGVHDARIVSLCKPPSSLIQKKILPYQFASASCDGVIKLWDIETCLPFTSEVSRAQTTYASNHGRTINTNTDFWGKLTQMEWQEDYIFCSYESGGILAIDTEQIYSRHKDDFRPFIFYQPHITKISAMNVLKLSEQKYLIASISATSGEFKIDLFDSGNIVPGSTPTSQKYCEDLKSIYHAGTLSLYGVFDTSHDGIKHWTITETGKAILLNVVSDGDGAKRLVINEDDPELLYMYSSNRILKIYDTRSNKIVKKDFYIKDNVSVLDQINDLSIIPDSRYMAVSYSSHKQTRGIVKLWSLKRLVDVADVMDRDNSQTMPDRILGFSSKLVFSTKNDYSIQVQDYTYFLE